VPPIEIPRICVCTAPDTPVEQFLLLIVVILGDIAEGGGDFTVVSDLLVDSVTIGSAKAWLAVKPRQMATKAAQMYRMIFII
jgi:hypothetical protein